MKESEFLYCPIFGSEVLRGDELFDTAIYTECYEILCVRNSQLLRDVPARRVALIYNTEDVS